MRVLNLEGQKFGNLFVVARLGSSEEGKATWICSCGCGNLTIVITTRLRNHGTKSCGCLRVKRLIEIQKTGKENSNYKHGGYSEFRAEHRAWSGMIQRCTNSNNEKYSIYGGRGIRVCERWRIFENFLADMGKKPSVFYSLERMNVNGDYEPSNCKWATAKEQNLNRRPYKSTVITKFSDDEIRQEVLRRRLVI